MIKNLGISLLFASTITSLCIFAFSLPGLGSGLWRQSETPAAMLHLCGAISALGIIILGIKYKNLTRACSQNPIVFFPAIIGVLSLIQTPLYDLPLRNILGTVRTGEGVAWWFDIAALSSAFLILWRLNLYKKILIITAISITILCFGLTLSFKTLDHQYTPYHFPDYLAFLALTSAPILLTVLKKHLSSNLSVIIIYLGLLGSIYATENQAMIVYALLMPLYLLIINNLSFIKGRHKLQLKWLALISIIPTVIVLMLLTAHFGGTEGFYSYSESGIFRTIASRAFLITTSISPILETPYISLIGTGWGTYLEHTALNLPFEWIELTDYSGRQWDGLKDDHFHSHNMYIETFSSIGILGALALILYTFAILKSAASKKKDESFLLASGFAVWASLWFMFPMHAAFLAFAAASTSKLSNKGKHSFTKIKLLTTFILSVCFVTSLSAAYITQSTALMTNDYEAVPLQITEDFEEGNLCILSYNDYGAGGIQLTRMLLNRARYLGLIVNEDLQKLQDIQITDDEKSPENIRSFIEEINGLYCETTLYTKTHHHSVQAELAPLMIRSEMLLGLASYMNQAEKEYYKKDWEQDLYSWLETAPKRTDQAIAYFLYNIIEQREDQSKAMIKHILRLNPNDPVGLWFKGLSLLNDPSKTEQGINALKRALDNGIERLMPIEEELLKMLKG